MAVKVILLVGAVLSLTAVRAVAQEPGNRRPTPPTNAPLPSKQPAERSSSASPPSTADKDLHATTSGPLKTKDGGGAAGQTSEEKKTAQFPAPDPNTPQAKYPNKTNGVAPAKKSEEERVIEAMDFLMLLEILKDYNLLSDR
jgi:cytoskeletal protein RodZ